MNVIYGSNGNDRDRLLISVKSVKRYMGDDTEIIVLNNNSSYSDLQHIQTINPEKYLHEVGFFKDGWNRRWPFETLFRLSIPLIEELSGEDRVLYLDTDVLCRSEEARNLNTIDMLDFEVLGAFDCDVMYGKNARIIDEDYVSEEAEKAMKDFLWDRRCKRAMTYINAGVTLLNLKQIRKNGIDWYVQRLKWFWEGETRGKFSMLDQDFINIMMDTAPVLDKTYNSFNFDTNAPAVFQHFVGGSKNKRQMHIVAHNIGLSR